MPLFRYPQSQAVDGRGDLVCAARDCGEVRHLEYRDDCNDVYRDNQAVSEHTTRTRTLDRLEDYEIEFACRYRGEARENLARRVHNMVQRVFGGRIGLSNVAEYREYRDDHAVSEPTTRTHRLGDILEQNQLHMATMATGGF